MQGKPLVRTLLLLTTLWVLQGCGFHLRGYDSESAALPSHISPLVIQGLGTYDKLRVELTRQLRSSGITITTEAEKAESALRISARSSDRRVLSTNSSGKVAEYELHERASFDLINRDSTVLVENQTISVIRNYTNNETQVLGKQNEEQLLRKTMQRDLAGRLIRRLQSQL